MNLRHILTAVMAITVLISCKNTETTEKITDSEENVVDATQVEVDNTDVEKRYVTAEFIVEGMSSETGCTVTIQNNMENLEGVKSVNIDFNTKVARVEYDDKKLSFDDLATTVTTSGDGKSYSVREMTNIEKSTEKNNKGCCIGKTDAEKAACSKKCNMIRTGEDKTACAEDCKKECCSHKKNN